jgi:cytochrome c oxidase subunit I
VDPDLLPTFELLHKISTIGSMILALGLFVAAGTLIAALFRGDKSPQNPWGGMSLEWATETPPPPHNFHHQPTVDKDPYHFEEIDESLGRAHG